MSHRALISLSLPVFTCEPHKCSIYISNWFQIVRGQINLVSIPPGQHDASLIFQGYSSPLSNFQPNFHIAFFFYSINFSIIFNKTGLCLVSCIRECSLKDVMSHTVLILSWHILEVLSIGNYWKHKELLIHQSF